MVTLAWPVLLPQDIQDMLAWPVGKARAAARRQSLQKRLVRIIEHGWQHESGPVLLTLAAATKQVAHVDSEESNCCDL